MSITKERWRDLCHQAATERDPEKLAKLNEEINCILQRASNSGQTRDAALGDEPTRSDGSPA